VSKISEGDTEFIHTMELVPAKDLGNICSSHHYALKIPFIANTMH